MDTPVLCQRYEIKRFLGQGGMAAVFLGWDRNLQVHRAIKLLHPSLLVRAQVRARFRNEALSMAQIHHPNVVHIYDHGLEGTSLFLVMEYLEGGSVEAVIKKNGALSIPQALYVTINIAKGLQEAHQKGYLHRDIKPENMLLDTNKALLADFGLVHIPEQHQTQTHAVMGTMGFMPPEQLLSAKRTTKASDIYALSASFFRMLTAQYPNEIFDEEVRTRYIRHLPQDIQSILHKGCAETPSERYEDVSLLIHDLEECTKLHSLEPVMGISSPTEADTSSSLNSIWSEYVSSSSENTLLSEDDIDSLATIHPSDFESIPQEKTIPFSPSPAQKSPSEVIEEKGEAIEEKTTQPTIHPHTKHDIESNKPTKSRSSEESPPLSYMGTILILLVLSFGIWWSTNIPTQTNPLPSGSRHIEMAPPTQEYMFFTLEQHILAVTLAEIDNKTGYSVFWGTKNKLYGQKIVSSSRNMEESWSFSFWDSRFGSGYQSSIDKKSDGSYILTCGEKEYALQPIPAPQNLNWFESPWNRSITFLAITPDMNYFIADQNRHQETPEYHLFTGTKGKMKQVSIQSIDATYNRYSIKTEEGILLLDNERGSWTSSGKSIELTNLDLWQYANMIYTELNIYPEKGLGTPCDLYFSDIQNHTKPQNTP